MLSGMLLVLCWLLAGLLALAIAVLATPVKLGFTLRASPAWRLTVILRLLGGLAPPIPLHDSARRKPKAKKRGARPRKSPALSHRAVARIRRAVVAAPGLVAGLLRPIRLERLAIDADIGLDDPADTGQLLGLLAAATHSLPTASAMSVAVRPDFTGPRVAGEVEAVLSFIPAAFVPPGLRFAWRVFGPEP
jgi:hypothetical protein